MNHGIKAQQAELSLFDEEEAETRYCFCCGEIATEKTKLKAWGLETFFCSDCRGARLDSVGRIDCEAHGLIEHLICSEPEFISEAKYGKGRLYPQRTRSGKAMYLLDYTAERIAEW